MCVENHEHSNMYFFYITKRFLILPSDLCWYERSINILEGITQYSFSIMVTNKAIFSYEILIEFSS